MNSIETTPVAPLSAQSQAPENDITTILEEGAREAYSRPWFRLERGLRINRLRLFVNENFTGDNLRVLPGLSPSEIEHVVAYLTKALDKKLLNTAKIVDYNLATQRIFSIKGFEVRRQGDGTIRCGFLKKRPETVKHIHSKSQASGTRRAKSVAAIPGTAHDDGEVVPA